MKRIRIVGLCLVAVFALSAVTASVASAGSPSWKECKKLAGAEKNKGNKSEPQIYTDQHGLCFESSVKIRGEMARICQGPPLNDLFCLAVRRDNECARYSAIQCR